VGEYYSAWEMVILCSALVKTEFFMPPPNVVWLEAHCFCPVRPCMRASVCASQNIVNMISCRVFDAFSPNLC